MNIDFKILWIEDDSDFVDSAEDSIIESIKELNLVPVINKYVDYDGISVDSIGNLYDLLLIDYNLPSNKVGTRFISRIRHDEVLPDVIFYSSSKFEDIIKSENDAKRESIISILQKGIYFSSSDNLVKLTPKVIRKIVNREEKVNGFRGIVLSFVSEFENYVNNILALGIDKLESKNEIKDYISNKILQSIKSDSELAHSNFITDKSDDKVKDIVNPKNRLLDHSKRTRIMNNVLKQLGNLSFDCDKYLKEVLKLRNALGHIKTTTKNNTQHYSFQMNDETIDLTPDYCSKKRKELLEWKKIFDDLHNYVNMV